MKNRILEKITKKHIFLAGIAVVLLSVIPYLILGVNSIVPYHDQLDGELIAYLYQAKYLFEEGIPQFLGGSDKTALVPPAPLAVLLFKILPPFFAYLIMQVLGQMMAYAGMFFLALKVTDKKWVALIVGLFYAYIPFLPVYGLAQYGMPMLLLCIWYLYEKKYVKLAFAYIALYALMSSLVLCGFACILVWMLGILYLGIGKQLKEHKEIVGGFCLLVCVYVLENLSLLAQMLGIGSRVVSHKSEYVLEGQSFWKQLIGSFVQNSAHCPDQHIWILLLTGLILTVCLLCRKRMPEQIRKKNKLQLFILIGIGLFCVIAAAWESVLGVALRSHLGAIGAFQAGRILWLTPALWYVELALGLDILWSKELWGKYVRYGMAILFCGFFGVICLKYSLVKSSVQELLIADYETISWSDYYALGVMDQVEEFIKETEGLEIEEYRVASLGIDPAAALYHGFYCVDGYSNNYSLEYKHAFRKVIAPELAKSDYLRIYYDGWGNRCYLLSSEIPGYFNIERGTFWYNNLELDSKALQELGCSYILSAAYIVNAEEQNLQLLNEEPILTEESYYLIYVYKVM